LTLTNISPKNSVSEPMRPPLFGRINTSVPEG
jgi:hypothetical protein